MSEKRTKKLNKKRRESEVSAGDAHEQIPKSRVKCESEVGHDIAAPETLSKEDEQKKRKRTKVDEIPRDSATSGVVNADTQLNLKNSKKRKQTVDAELPGQPVMPDHGTQAMLTGKRRKKQQQTENDKTVHESTDRADASRSKPKRSKKRNQFEDDGALNGSTSNRDRDGIVGADTQSMPQKSKHRKEGHKDDAKGPLSLYPDPSDDESITEQSRKALIYAFERFQASELWKFNKARQNWLLRNFWSQQAIPEKYIPLVIRYFADLKGGSREKLIEACNSKICATESTQIVSVDDNTKPLSELTISCHSNGHRVQSLLQSLLQSSEHVPL